MSVLPFARPFISEAMIAAVADTLRSRWIASGPQVAAFEAALAKRCADRAVRSFTSATGAMEVALEIMRIGPGDEVITPAQTFFAAPNMIARRGATPVFVDCELESRNVDFAALERAITPRTKALLPTHYLAPLDLDRLYAIAQAHNLRVLEDAALAFGADWRGTPIGARGDVVAFSFHPNKNLTTIEGGALTFADPAEAKRAEALRFHGIVKQPDYTRDVESPGGKFNLSDVSARLGLAQLEVFAEMQTKREALAAHYFKCWDEAAIDPPCVLPPRDAPGCNWNMFCVLLPLERLRASRAQLIDEMKRRDIALGISYEAAHLTTCYRKLGYREGMLPVSERIARETVTLPLFVEMSFADVERVVGALSDVLRQCKR